MKRKITETDDKNRKTKVAKTENSHTKVKSHTALYTEIKKKSTKNNANKVKNVKFEKPSKNQKVKNSANNLKNKTDDEPTEKPDWSKVKKERDELKKQRKEKRLSDVFTLSTSAKQIYEKLRQASYKKGDRAEQITKLHNILKGHYDKLIFLHDMSRVVQLIIKISDTKIRQDIFDELQPHIILAIQTKYATNCIKSLLKTGSEEIREGILKACYGKIVKLCCHAVGSLIIELGYTKYASELVKQHFRQEFYGNMYKESKDDNIHSLSDVYKTSPEMKAPTLTAVKGNLVRIFSGGFKSSVLIESITWDFLNNCSNEDKNETLEAMREFLLELSQSKTGANIALECIWYSNNKEKKAMMKSLKGNVKTLAMSEYGYLLLLAIFDSVDDTVLVKKIILPEIQSDVTEIALNEYGKNVILYLVARRDTHYFAPNIIDHLKKGDNNGMSKKPADIRAKELSDSVSKSFLSAIAADVKSWLQNGSIAMVTLAILKNGVNEDSKDAFESIASFITEKDSIIKEGENECHIVEHAGIHMMLKKLIQHDKVQIENGSITFGEILLGKFNKEVLENWIQFNRGCFLLVLLLENESDSTQKSLLSLLKEVQTKIKTLKYSGANILLKKLK